MKVAILFEVRTYSGGLLHQSLGVLDYIMSKEFSDYDIEIILISNSPKLQESLTQKYKKKLKFFQFHKLAERYGKLFDSGILNIVLKKLNFKNPFEKFLIKNKYDLVFFLAPTKYINYCGNINFIVNLFDFNHRLENIFPEYRKEDIIYDTERIIKKSVTHAYKILVNSLAAKNDLLNLYNCPNQKIDIINYSSNLINKFNNNENNINCKKKLEKFIIDLGLNKKKNLLFYPAQFWPHKNHKYLVDVAKKLVKKNIDFQLIFCGAKKINYEYIKKEIVDNDLTSKIIIFDYLEDEEVISIYHFCKAVIVPTYVGRSSLPLLESIYFNKKIFYSQNILDGEIEKIITPFDLKNPDDLANKLIDFLNKDISEFKDDIILSEKYQNFLMDNKKSKEILKKIFNEFNYLIKRWKK